MNENQKRTVEYSRERLLPMEDGILKPIIKWPGGKEKELSYILRNAPNNYENYYEPFVGGGSVFMAFHSSHAFINDKSAELIRLYRYIALQDDVFFTWLDSISEAWERTLSFACKNKNLCNVYVQYRSNKLDNTSATNALHSFVSSHADEINKILPNTFKWKRELFFFEVEKCLVHKFLRMKKIEQDRKIMPEQDIYDNIETAFTSAMYTYLRTLYNSIEIHIFEQLYTALFVFLRNYAYSGMFRYNDKGEFNVPYGGISYNHKSMTQKKIYYKSLELLQHFSNTTIENYDFEEFFNLYQPTPRDFVFLDPPYDTEFSTYSQNEFTKQDQKRLADYLCLRCQAMWMLVIKYTPFVFSLYNREGIVIKKFDKKYMVSFMNRNDKDAEHLIIMNYNNKH